MNYLTKLKTNLVIGVIFGFLVIVLFLWWGDYRELQRLLDNFPAPTIFSVLLLSTLGYLLRLVKWNLFLKSLDIKLNSKTSAIVFFSGLTMSITPGKVGEVLKSFLLERSNGVPVTRTAPIVLTERITDLLAMVFLASLGVTLFANGLEVLIGTTVFIGAFIGIVQSKPLSLKLIELLGKLPLIGKFNKSFLNLYESTYTMLRFKVLLQTLLISIASWFMECLALYLILQGFQAEQSIIATSFVFSFSSVAGAISMLPGGLGVAEGSMTGLLVFLGITKGVAVAATLILRLGTLWYGVFLGTVTLLLNLKLFTKANEENVEK